MTVVVHNGPILREYDNVTALGIGHIRQDLVLVSGDVAPIKIGPDHWTRIEVHREPPRVVEPPSNLLEPPLRGIRLRD